MYESITRVTKTTLLKLPPVKGKEKWKAFSVADCQILQDPHKTIPELLLLSVSAKHLPPHLHPNSLQRWDLQLLISAWNWSHDLKRYHHQEMLHAQSDFFSQIAPWSHNISQTGQILEEQDWRLENWKANNTGFEPLWDLTQKYKHELSFL